ncbi:MAG TPA: serine hydrolase domain-containing protein [Acidimicrobiales bacterium]|jgi:CubicO group peptidase (beta-lactamase class C family)
MTKLAPSLRVELSQSSSRLSPETRNELVGRLFEMTENSFPAGFNLSIVEKTGPVFRAWGGFSNLVDPIIETSSNTIYDLASLTKVVSTTTLALWLEQQNRWRFDDHVAKWLPGFPREDLTLVQLLTHTSGLIPHRPFFHLGQRPAEVRRAVYEEATHGTAPGQVVYSDLNFMLLGWAIANCSKRPLDQLFREVVAEPLGMRDTRYRPNRRDLTRIAATERNGDQRLQKGLVWGEVHDGNAWSLRGVAGHAGLFGSSDDLGRFVQALLNPRRHPVLTPSSIAQMTRVQAGSLPDVRGLGWRLQPVTWGDWPVGTFWHTGFTGTSLLISPSANLGVVLMMNAVHPTRQLERQEAVRVSLHRTLAEAVA